MAFKLAPDGALTVLHAFAGASDGGLPYAGLMADGAGNLYGTTFLGGASGYGVVFKLSPGGAIRCCTPLRAAPSTAPTPSL